MLLRISLLTHDVQLTSLQAMPIPEAKKKQYRHYPHDSLRKYCINLRATHEMKCLLHSVNITKIYQIKKAGVGGGGGGGGGGEGDKKLLFSVSFFCRHRRFGQISRQFRCHWIYCHHMTVTSRHTTEF